MDILVLIVGGKIEEVSVSGLNRKLFLRRSKRMMYLGPVIFSCYAEIHGMADSRIVEMCLRMQPGS